MEHCMRLGSVVRAYGRALSTAAGRQQRRALAADTADHDQVTKKNFADVQRERKEQANHSILISCPPKINEEKFLNKLSQHGEVANHFFFTSSSTHALVEYVNAESIDSLLAATKVPKDEDSPVVPFKSRFIRLKAHESGSQVVHCPPQSPISIGQLIDKLNAAKSIEHQLHILLEVHQLTEESIRLRYLVSSLVRDLATAYFPEATVDLYGSSVNSFGKLGCDLDLYLNLDSIKAATGKVSGSYGTEFFMRRVSCGRILQQKILSVVGECIDSFGPGCTEVHKILNARCPLVRFFHKSSDLHCDLTADNRIALRASELLYLYGNIDSRVRPLVFAIRCWARVHGITSTVSGHWITNFSLTTMVLFYLQKRNPPVIPTLDHLKNLAGKKDKCIIEDHDCTFVSDLSKIHPSKNTESLDHLLFGLLEFYGNFDFSKNGIDIRQGVENKKPDSSPLYIQNPFELSLNISKNVNKSQMDRFVQIIKESVWILQEDVGQSSESGNETWGLSSLLIPSKGSSSLKRTQASDRLSSIIDSLSIGNNHGQKTGNNKEKC